MNASPLRSLPAPPVEAPTASGPAFGSRATVTVLRDTLGETEGADNDVLLGELTNRVRQLRDPSSSVALDELATHIPVLNALFLDFAQQALRSKNPDHRAKLLRAALTAQQAHGRTVALLEGLELQRKGLSRVQITDNDNVDDN